MLKKPNKITVTTAHWRVPSVERALEGFVEGKPSEELKRQIEFGTLRERAAWKPGAEAMRLVEQLKAYVGCRVHIQFWDPIMNMLDDEGPFPLEADCKDVVLLQHGEFLQAYLVIDDIREKPTQDGYSPQGYLVSIENISGYLAPLSELYEIWPIVKPE